MKILAILLLLTLSTCGYIEKGSHAKLSVSQIRHFRPGLCPDRVVLVGALADSKREDFEAVVPKKMVREVRKALSENKVIEVEFKMKRIAFCGPSKILTSVQIKESLQDKCLELAKSVEELKTCKSL